MQPAFEIKGAKDCGFCGITRDGLLSQLPNQPQHFGWGSAGGPPAFFGRSDRPSGRSISLLVSNLSSESGPRLPGPSLQTKEDALWEGHVFDLSRDISAAYRDLIPDMCRHDHSKLVPLEICRTILADAIQRRGPENFGKRHLSLALMCAADVFARLVQAELSLVPEDEEALASMVVDPPVRSGT